MRKEIELWLEELNLPIGRLPQKWCLPTMAVVEAAESVYNKIHNSGEFIKPIRVGWEIRGIADGIANRKDISEVRAIETAHEKIGRLRKELDYHRMPMRKKFWRFLTKKRSFKGISKK